MKTASDPRRSNVPHSIRQEVRGVCHVVLRVRRGLPWLRTPKTYRVLERALRAGKEKQGFALVQYSVQRDHLHLLMYLNMPSFRCLSVDFFPGRRAWSQVGNHAPLDLLA